MPHGYGYFTFGFNQAEREADRIRKFNERWKRLTTIHEYLLNDFVRPLDSASERLTVSEYSKFVEYLEEVSSWNNAISSSIDDANQNHLTRYSTSIRKLAMKAIRLCQKYDVYGDIEAIEYVAKQKTIVFNGEALYYIG